MSDFILHMGINRVWNLGFGIWDLGFGIKVSQLPVPLLQR